MSAAVFYLAAIVAANLTITGLGPDAVIPVGFALIGLSLVLRDRLHDRLAARGLLLGGLLLGGLILAGGAISYAINADAGRVALASFVAFTVAQALDGLVYQVLRGRTPVVRSAVSNVPAAAADSWLFLALAFPGPAPILLVLGQFAAKAVGGLVWAAVIYRDR